MKQGNCCSPSCFLFELAATGCFAQEHDALASLVVALETEFGCLVGVNAYLTPPGTQGWPQSGLNAPSLVSWLVAVVQWRGSCRSITWMRGQVGFMLHLPTSLAYLWVLVWTCRSCLSWLRVSSCQQDPDLATYMTSHRCRSTKLNVNLHTEGIASLAETGEQSEEGDPSLELAVSCMGLPRRLRRLGTALG